MPKIHILDETAPHSNAFNAVLHYLLPTGANPYGTTWLDCYKASFGTGAPTSRLPSSGNNNPATGKIGNTELAQITSGTVVEIDFTFGNDLALSDADRLAMMNMFADREIETHKANLLSRFRYYGFTTGAVT